MLFGHDEDSYSGILGSKTACVYPKLIAACHALHRFVSQGIPYMLCSRIVLLGSFWGNITHTTNLAIDLNLLFFCNLILKLRQGRRISF